jgi:hypothetical protein
VAVKTIETRAIVSAQDHTGNTFSQIAQKLKAMEDTAKAAGRSMGATTRVAANSGEAVRRTLHEQQRVGNAMASAAGVAALVASHKLKEVARNSVETYKHFDDLVRYQRAVMGMNDQQQKPLIDQAIHMGANTKFNDLQVLEAQLSLAQRGIKENLIQPIVEMAGHYGQAMDVSLPAAAKTLESIIFSTAQEMTDAATAMKNSKKTLNFAVKLAKVGGMDSDDVSQFFKFGGASGHVAGLSMETMGALGALMRRSNIRGDESGVAVRSIAGSLVSPTSKGLDALRAMGINYNDFVKLPEGRNADNLGLSVKQKLGKSLSPAILGKLTALIKDPDVFGTKEDFIAAATPVIGQAFGRDKKGHLRAQDSKAIAGVAGTFWKMMIESVNTEGLLRKIIENKPTAAQANAIFTKQQGGRFMTAAQHGLPEFDEVREKLAHVADDFAESIGKERMGGFSGAIDRASGAARNLETALGRANADLLTFGANLAGKAINAAAKANPDLLQGGTRLGLIAAALGTLKGAFVGGEILGHMRGVKVNPLSVTPLGVAAAIGSVGYDLSKLSSNVIFSNKTAFSGAATNPLLGAMAPDVALGAAVANQDEIRRAQELELETSRDWTLGGMGRFMSRSHSVAAPGTFGRFSGDRQDRVNSSGVGTQGGFRSPNAEPKFGAPLRFEPVKIEARFEVIPGSAFLDLVRRAETVTARSSVMSGIGSMGSTDFGGQQP